MIICKIDGVVIPTPKNNLKSPTGDLQSEGYTDALGFTHKETIRYTKERYDCEWGYLTNNEMALLLSLTSKEWFSFEIIGAQGAIISLSKAYRGNVDRTLMTARSGKAEWKDVKIPIIGE